MKIKTFVIDAFTDKPFKGNPAGVCLLETSLEPALMQSIAAEINLAETAFLLPDAQNATQYTIRYFTPTVEIAFCGHATLASAQLLLEKFQLNQVNFTTHHQLKISALKDGAAIQMKFPLYDNVAYTPSTTLLNAFGVSAPLATRFSKELGMLVIEVSDNEELIALQPDLPQALKSPETDIKTVIITAKSQDEHYDFYSRCFGPWVGIDEDPVTGSSHTILAKYWGDKLRKTAMVAYQSSKRGGFMHLQILNEKELQVTGKAVMMLEGIMTVPI